MRFEIPMESPRFRNTVYCNSFIEDIDMKIYKPKKRIIETAYQADFNPIKKVQTEIVKVEENWITKIREIFN